MEPTEMTARKKYSEEFKQEALRLLETRGDRTIADVAESLGVAPAVLYTWRGQAGAQSAERRERGETAEEELKRLRRELAQTRQERDILKNDRGSRSRLWEEKLLVLWWARFGRSGRRIFGDDVDPVKKHGPGAAAYLEVVTP